jgi:hypothetical protein
MQFRMCKRDLFNPRSAIVYTNNWSKLVRRTRRHDMKPVCKQTQWSEFTLLTRSISAPDNSRHRTSSALPTLAARWSADCPACTIRHARYKRMPTQQSTRKFIENLARSVTWLLKNRSIFFFCSPPTCVAIQLSIKRCLRTN